MKNDRWVLYKDVKLQDMGGGLTRRVPGFMETMPELQ